MAKFTAWKWWLLGSCLWSGCLSSCVPKLNLNLNLFPTCTIGGTQISEGAAEGADPCQTCQPGVSTSAFSPVADGGSCGGLFSSSICLDDRCFSRDSCFVGGEVTAPDQMCPGGGFCVGPECEMGCLVPGSGFLSSERVVPFQTVNQANPCQVCSDTEPFGWSPAEEGQGCGADSVCHDGQCLMGCFIDGGYAAPGLDPNNPCQFCEPDYRPDGWVVYEDSWPCDGGNLCSGGTCQPSCPIDGGLLWAGAKEPGVDCQVCQPATRSFGPASDGTACSACQACQSGACAPVELAIPALDPQHIAADDGGVFVTDPDAGVVWGAPQSGGGPNSEITGLVAPAGVAVSSGVVYVADPGGKLIAAAPATGGAAHALVESLQAPLAVATNGARLYWADHGFPDAGVAGSVSGFSIADGGFAISYGIGTAPLDLAVDELGLYWVDDSVQEIFFAPLDGGAAVELGSTHGTPRSVALDGAWVYWATAGGQIFQRSRLTGQEITLGQGANNPLGMASDGVNLYVTEQGTALSPGSVARIPVDGGPATVLFTGGMPSDVALAGQCVLVTVPGVSPRVLRMDR
jgi:hypothetical protein